MQRWKSCCIRRGRMRSKDVRILGITDIIATGSDVELIND
jgi:hypothetical protein